MCPKSVVKVTMPDGEKSAGSMVAVEGSRTVAMGVAGVDLLAKSVLIFGFGVQVFVEEPGLHSRAYFWAKWGYWGARAFIAALVYGVLTALPSRASSPVALRVTPLWGGAGLTLGGAL